MAGGRASISARAVVRVLEQQFLDQRDALAAALPGSFDEQGVTSSGGLLLLLILVYSIVLSVLAGWLTATIARRSPAKHALALGLIQLALGIAAQTAYWELMPLWYHLPFLALLIPGNLLGAHLRGERPSAQTA